MTKTASTDYRVADNGRRYWNRRNSLGQFVNRHGFNRSDRAWSLSAWHAYLESRYSQAEEYTRGNMVSEAGERRGVRGSRLMAPGASDRYRSEELQEWFQQNGETLYYAEFRAQVAESPYLAA